MCEYLNDYLARILPLFVLAVSLILGAICSLGNGHQMIRVQPLSQASGSVTQTPPFSSRSFYLDNGSPYWPTHTRAYLTDFPTGLQYGGRTKQPVTSSPSFETQPAKQVRFTSQDAVDMRQAPPVAAGGGREQTNMYHYQPARLQLNQELLSRHFLPESPLINTRHPPNMIGKIQSKQTAHNPSNPVPISPSSFSWSPTYGQQHRLALAMPIDSLNPAGRIATKLVPDDTIQETNDDFQVHKSYPAQTRTSKNGCFGDSIGRLYSGARNLVTGALKQYATPGSLMLGSSLIAAAIPLSSMLVLPTSESWGRRDSKDELGNSQDSNHNKTPSTGPLPLPVTQSLFTVQGRVDSVMGWIERSVEHLPNFPRLHPQECVKRSICEAHNEPNKYGAIGFVLRLFFPATNLSITDRMDDMDYKVINKYRYAAGYGLNKRIDNNGSSSAACKEKYEDCLVSLLDVAQNLIDIFLK